jgi:hypothetical protein
MKKLLVVSFILLGCVAFAEEVVVKSDPSIWISISSHLTDAILAVLTAILGWFAVWLKGKAGERKATVEAIEALKGGVESAWNDIAKQYKAASADGQLTEEEKARLRTYAIEKAKTIATGPAKQILIGWGSEILAAKIKDIINNWKAQAAKQEK